MDKLIELDELKKENKQLEQDLYIALNKIDKAIKYIRELKCNADEKCFDDLLQILGDKENE